MKTNSIVLVLICGLSVSSQILCAQDHGHLNVGAVAQTNGAQAVWDNGAAFTASSGYVKTLDYTNAGKYAGYYQNNITPTVLPATGPFGGPTAGAPALGALIHGRLSLLEGPADGRFGFWESTSDAASGPYISIGVGQTATNMFRITQTDGSPTADPFGHIHGRRLSATKPGLYKVGFQAVDVSTNGVGGGPIHTPSVVLPIWFQAGPTIASISKTNNVARITYGSITNRTGIVEYSTNLSQTNWNGLSTNGGTDYFRAVSDTNATGGQRYYRFRVTLP
jgi:hypothetical protein